jgi:SAM-dependent methyltransferase
MTSNRSSHRRRECFDEVSVLYDKARPSYPADLVRDLIEAADIGPGCRILEIGCGAGQLTVPLAQTGASLTAVDLGPNLGGIARSKLASYSNAEVLTADFDTWLLPCEPFDVVVAATAFHWLDPDTRVEKCARALRPGGILAIVDSHWGTGPGRDDFSTASQDCYARWDPHHRSDFVSQTLGDLPETRADLASSPCFEQLQLKRYPVERQYSADQYCDLLRTFSDVRAFDDENRNGFLSCIHSLIQSRFAGSITRHDVYDLWKARTVANASPIHVPAKI